MDLLVGLEVAQAPKALPALRAAKRLLARVDLLVGFEHPGVTESLGALGAAVRLVPAVDLQVVAVAGLLGEALPAV